jgi:hypothetical protein
MKVQHDSVARPPMGQGEYIARTTGCHGCRVRSSREACSGRAHRHDPGGQHQHQRHDQLDARRPPPRFAPASGPMAAS